MSKQIRSAVASNSSKSKKLAKVDLRVVRAAQLAMEALEDRTYFGNGSPYATGDPGWFAPGYSCPTSSTPIQHDPNSGSDNNPSNQSGQPVTYENGAPIVNTTDLQSNAFGKPWGITRSWIGADDTGQLGNGWATTDLPYLIIHKRQAYGGIVQVVNMGGSSMQFDIAVNGTTFTPRGLTNATLEYRPGVAEQIEYEVTYFPGQFVLTDAEGNQTIFWDLPRGGAILTDANGAKYGQLTGDASYPQQPTQQWIAYDGTLSNTATDVYRFGAFAYYTDASRNYTIRANYNGTTGNLASVVRTDGSGAYERLYYEYATVSNSTTGASASLVSRISLQKASSDSGPWTTVRAAEYAYYTGDGADSNNGRLGDLKLVTIKDYQKDPLNPEIVDQDYYRYYKFHAYNWFSNPTAPTDVVTANNDNDAGGTGGTDTTFANTGGENAVMSGLKAVVEGANFSRLEANYSSYTTVPDVDTVHGTDSNGDGNFDNDDIRSYANNFFRYERLPVSYVAYDDHAAEFYRVVEETAASNGCSTCSGGFGTTKFVYTTGSLADPWDKADAGLDPNIWCMKTVEYLPDDTNEDADHDGNIDSGQWDDNDYNIIYTNEVGQIILSVLVDRNGTTSTTDDKEYLTYNHYDSADHKDYIIHPSALSGYDEGYSDLVDFDSNYSGFISTNSGLIDHFVYATTTSGTISSTVAGDVAGYLKGTYERQGLSGTDIQISSQDYYKHTYTYNGNVIYPVADETVYYDVDGVSGDDAVVTHHDYDWQLDGSGTETNRVLSDKISHPIVSTLHNGSGSAQSSVTVFDTVGRPIWTKDEDGFITYTEFDNSTGAVTKKIVDVDTTKTADFSNLPSGWSTPTGGGAHLITTMQVDGLGRTTKVTDPNGDVTYTVYNDDNHEVRVYRGWTGSGTTGSTTGPIEVVREIRDSSPTAADGTVGRVYTEALTSSATPTALNGAPTGEETIDSSNIQSLTRGLTNDAGQTVELDQYTSLDGITYDYASAQLGSPGTNYLATITKYDGRGRVKSVTTPDGTITRTLYDARGLTMSVWKGTDDSATTGYWSPTNEAGTNLVKIVSNIYDNGGTGDGNLTESRSVTAHDTTTGDDTSYYATDYQYDSRDRLIQSRGADGVATKYTLDTDGHRVTTETYADADDDFVIDAGELRGKSVSAFDGNGRVFQSSVYHVDPSTGANPGQTGDRLTTNYWYDGRGNLIKTENANGVFNKTEYDGAGRAVANYTSYDSAESSYSDAANVTGDTVVEQTKTIYDQGGRPVATTTFMRLENDTTSTGELTPTNSYIQTGVTWYDVADRVIDTANYGRDNGTTRYVYDTSGNLIDSDSDSVPDEAENSPRLPNTSDDYLATKTEYDAGGRAYRSTDNKGQITQTDYDLLGRQTKLIENYVDGTPSETETDTDRTTESIYDSSGRLATLRAEDPKGSGNGVENQDTKYLYESDIDRSWVTNTIYPDSSDTDSSGSDQVKDTYDRLGRKTTETDERGVVHTYSYDSAGRLQSDAITTLPSGVDGSVQRIETSYDDLSRQQNETSYDASIGGNVVNDVKFTYDGWGNVIKDEQDHDSAVGAGSPAVQYTYSDGAVGGEAKYVRLDSITYADGRVIHYNYPSSGVGNALMRLDNIANDSAGTTKYVQYSYLGADTVVKETHPQVTNGLVLDYSQGGTYAGWDRFMRIIDQKWSNSAGTTTLDEYKYTYDRASNRTTRDNTTASGLDEAYTYDGLNRLSGYNRGNLSGGTITDASANLNQKWTLDSTGNWQNFQWDNSGGGNSYTTQSRASNAANETGAITGTGADWLDPVYDSAGNMTSGPKPKDGSQQDHYVYDGWDRLVAVYNDNGGVPGTLSQTYQYDGLGRRTNGLSAGSGQTQDYYYDTKWRMLQQQLGGSGAKPEEYIWSERYADSPVVRFRDTNGDGSMDETFYYTTDANNNVTAMVQTTGSVQERYSYDPYGSPHYYNGSWTSLSDTQKSNRLLYGGAYHLGGSNGLYYIRNRYYNPTLGRFLTRDPSGYGADGMNLFQYVESDPETFIDPLGTDATSIGIVIGGTIGGGIGGLIGVIVGGSAGTVAEPGGGTIVGGAAGGDVGIGIGVGIGTTVGGAIGGVIGNIIGTKPTTITIARRPCPSGNCKPCIPPAGTIAIERVDIVPPSEPHWPFTGTHSHLVQMNQAPYPSCKCFWNKANPPVVDGVPPLPPKTGPAGGGPA